MIVTFHPVRWDAPVRPDDLLARVQVVENGAYAAGARADALVVIDDGEHCRRKEAGLGAVTSLGLLDAAMNLPLDVPVRRDDLSAATLRRLERAPEGVIRFEGEWITRVVRQPLTVVAAVIRGRGWRIAMRRAAAFGPLAQRILFLDSLPAQGDMVLWEARLAGVGVWVLGDGEVRQVLAPALFQRRYVKAAGWRFAERAYGSAIANDLSSSPFAFAGRPTSTDAAASGRRQVRLPLR